LEAIWRRALLSQGEYMQQLSCANKKDPFFWQWFAAVLFSLIAISAVDFFTGYEL
jgi:hypothetical protein